MADAREEPVRYPAEWEFDAVLADGGTVHVRPIRPDDAAAHLAFFERLSPETRYYRFFSPKATLTPEESKRFTEVDYRDRFALVALHGDAIIAVARYERQGAAPEAEVAFVIDDANQGRGIGTLLLEYLAAAAHDNGITRFTAEVLPDNRRMLDVFQDAGYRTVAQLDGGVVRVELLLEQTERSRAAVEHREHVAEAASIRRMLCPRSVAVIGASHEPGTIGYHLFLNVLAGGFAGPAYPVNPSSPHVASVPTYPSVLDIPGEVDLAVIAVPAASVPAVVDQCVAKGVKGLVVISAGFSETGAEGAALERDVVTRARRGGMRLIGPNCLGIANTAVGLNATFAPRVPPRGRVGFQSQSGALGIALLEWTDRLGIGLSSFVSVGNKADVSSNDLLQYWEDDPDTDVILLYLESFGNPRKFSRIARRVSQRKPIVAVKSGRSASGVRAASSHTAAAASPEVAVSALFHQTGVIRVDTIDELFDMAQVLVSQPLPDGPRVAIVGNSGGPGILAADACDGAGLDVVVLAPQTREALRALLGPNASVTNPVDMVASATPAHYEQALRLVLADENVDAVIVIFTPPLVTRADEVAEAIASAAEGATKPVLANFLASRDVPAALQGGSEGRRRIPSFPTPEPAARALGRLVRYAAWKRRDPGRVPVFADIDRGRARQVVDAVLARAGVAAAEAGVWLDAGEAVTLLRAYGLAVLEVHPVSSADDAAAVAERIGFPVAVKAAAGALVHKTDVGAVRLGLASAEQVREAFEQVTAAAADHGGGVVVQAMAESGVETIVGVVQDPAFGPLVMFGMGGVATELLADRAFRIVPVTDTDAAEVVRSLRASPLLFGYRGAAPVATGALEELLVRVGVLADELPEVVELDLNPVIATPAGVVAVDAKVRVRPVEPHRHDELRRVR
ncbi:bifunctional acetate--CoA ligase family protein/GNAT family N-acetyltransferase [Rhabdothermincola sp.]|uniref:bifunctional acetate--CoA ligase family protein/GNAT family N-acetyltransferase n=1 Tax=Rhabdothermincola sp. TaxID=2820405 RepID=UPI002FDF6574